LPDSFHDLYVGRLYPGVTEDTAFTASKEVLSMGMEILFGTDRRSDEPILLDEGYIDFVLGTLLTAGNQRVSSGGI
jgi:hypothetical protein